MPRQPSVAALAERAVAWALDQVGSPAYAARCLAFVEDAYERANAIEVFGGASAADSAAIYDTRPIGETPPPRGALVFFDCAGPIGAETRAWGHVGLSLGDGRLVHAWDRVRVDAIGAIHALPLSPGWSAPELLGWTPAERVMAGSRPRDWDDG